MGIRQRQYFCPRCKRPTLWVQYVPTLGDIGMFAEGDYHCQQCGEGQPPAKGRWWLWVLVIWVLTVASCGGLFLLASYEISQWKPPEAQQPSE